MIPLGYTHHGEQNVTVASCEGDKRLVVSFSLAHFACVVSPGDRFTERSEGGKKQQTEYNCHNKRSFPC